VIASVELGPDAVACLVKAGYLPGVRDVNAVRLAFGQFVERALRRAAYESRATGSGESRATHAG